MSYSDSILRFAQSSSGFGGLTISFKDLFGFVVQDRDVTTPPVVSFSGDSEGLHWIVATGAGAFAGLDGKIVTYHTTGEEGAEVGTWSNFAPFEGMLVWIADENVLVVYNGSAWQTVTIT